jgi:hypothetical protein
MDDMTVSFITAARGTHKKTEIAYYHGRRNLKHNNMTVRRGRRSAVVIQSHAACTYGDIHAVIWRRRSQPHFDSEEICKKLVVRAAVHVQVRTFVLPDLAVRFSTINLHSLPKVTTSPSTLLPTPWPILLVNPPTT